MFVLGKVYLQGRTLLGEGNAEGELNTRTQRQTSCSPTTVSDKYKAGPAVPRKQTYIFRLEWRLNCDELSRTTNRTLSEIKIFLDLPQRAYVRSIISAGKSVRGMQELCAL